VGADLNLPDARSSALVPEPDFGLGTVTGIGSLPHDDAATAVAFVLDRLSDLPAAPTLPNVDPRQGLLAEGVWGIQGVTVDADGTVTAEGKLDPAAPLADEALEGPPFAGTRAFLAAVAGRTGAVKLQLPGPLTIGTALLSHGVKADLAYAVAASAVNQRAKHLVALARAALPEATIVVFVDEPALHGGVIGLPVPVDRVIDMVSGALASIEADAVTGIHCCGETDWRIPLQAGPQVLSLPATAEIGPYTGALASFVERGGWLAWGVVPTDGPRSGTVGRLWRTVASRWCELVQAGCDPVRLRHHTLLTPECGLALHTVGQAERIFDLVHQLAERLQDQLTSVRLSVGA
jgi:methionine synthase II (cobalamin-independent)